MNPVMRFIRTCAAVATLAIVGCSSSSNNNSCSSASTGSLGGAFGGGSTSSSSNCSQASCPVITDTSACGACLAQHCCTQATTCKSDSACAACITTCQVDGTACDECVAANQNATNFGLCVEDSCTSQCTGGGSSSGSSSSGSSSGGGDVCSASPDDTACDTCTEQSCCPQATACADDSECTSISENATSLAEAQEEAEEANDAPAENLVNCLEGSCATPCGN